MRGYRQFFVLTFLLLFCSGLMAQDQVVVIPKRIDGAPFAYPDSANLFDKAYHLFREGLTGPAIDSLKKLLDHSGFRMDQRHYYLVVANFTDNFSPIGLFHEGSSFFDTRLYGLKDAKLYYVFISRKRGAPSFVSTLFTAKNSPFLENLPEFLGLFFPVLPMAFAVDTTWVDVREYDIPQKFRQFSTISVVVKTALEAEKRLATASLDNSAKERWSYGLATAVTSVSDLDFDIGNDGVIIVRPKPRGDPSIFGVINFHFKAVDTKAKTLATSFHLLGGLRIAKMIEPIIGLGFGVPLAFLDVHLFGGYSVEFAEELKEGFEVGDPVTEQVDPFKLKLRGKPRFGIELKFP